jgi:polysaccharide export outer membrane protein
MKNYLLSFIKLFAFLLLFSCIFSCGSVTKYKYFTNIPDSGKVVDVESPPYVEPLIANDDLLYILIQTSDLTAAAAINSVSMPGVSSQTSTPVTGTQLLTTGNLVNKNGDINLPVIGLVHVAGFTIPQAREILTNKAAVFYKEPTVIVRFLNFKINVLGEVQRPGPYNTPNEKVTIIDALAYAGDLTIYGRRDNVLLIRKKLDGITNEFIRINLNRTDFINSPAYYLQPNDAIYVEPLQTKITSSDATQGRNISIASIFITLIIGIISVTKK